MPEFRIANRKVGDALPPLVIAEIGINHEGSLKTAKEIVDAAISVGAEVIKHQTHVVDDEMSLHAKEVIPGNATDSIYDIMSRCALNEQDEFELKQYIESKGAIFLSTPFSRAAVDRLEKFGVVAYKIGSGECNNYPLIRYVASKGKPIILSTGMNTIKDIRQSVKIFEQYNISYALLHCTNVYPTPPELIRLGAISELAANFPDAVVGLSDHSISNLACLGAVAVGASILERHFIDFKDRPGPDIVCSMTPLELKELMEQSSILAKMRNGRKGIVDEERVTINFAYASVIAIEDIQPGERFTEKNIWVKRPGTGDFLAKDYQQLLGKKTRAHIKAGTQIKQSQVVDQ